MKRYVLLFLMAFGFLSAETQDPTWRIVKNKPFFSLTAEFECRKNEDLDGKLIRTGRFAPRYYYDLYDSKHQFLARGITRAFSLGQIFPWGMEIDVYDMNGDYLGLIDGKTFTWARVDMKGIYDQFIQMENEWDIWSFCLPIRSPSSIAVNQVNNIDFLHLDGDYTAIGSLQDVQLYLPKVKSGGYVLLSNLFTMVKGKQPKLKSFLTLFDSCEIVAEIERDNAILFRKKTTFLLPNS